MILIKNSGNDISFLRDGHVFRLRAAAVILHENQVLMMGNNTVPYLYSVGGAVQLGETTEEAVRREVLEETGLQLTVDRLLAVHQNFFVDKDAGGETWHEMAFYYLMKTPEAMAQSRLKASAKERTVWVPVDRFDRYDAYPKFFKDMKALLASPVPVYINTWE